MNKLAQYLLKPKKLKLKELEINLAKIEAIYERISNLYDAVKQDSQNQEQVVNLINRFITSDIKFKSQLKIIEKELLRLEQEFGIKIQEIKEEESKESEESEDGSQSNLKLEDSSQNDLKKENTEKPTSINGNKRRKGKRTTASNKNILRTLISSKIKEIEKNRVN